MWFALILRIQEVGPAVSLDFAHAQLQMAGAVDYREWQKEAFAALGMATNQGQCPFTLGAIAHKLAELAA